MKLSNLARVILSKPARVILSKAKNPVLAASLVALVACTDYLEDFQDKYDDGNAFAEISSDSELSSSSKGNGDAESSDSKNSSSSVGNGTFSSGSISYERCSGTVIYDASKDSLNGIFGYPFMTNYASGMQASSKGIKAKLRDQTEFLTLALADLSKDKTRDIETWGGLCIEYSSDGQADFVLLNDSLGKVRRFLSNKLPVTNGDKASFKWLWSENEKLQEKQAELGYSNEPLSINKVSRLHFDNYYPPKTTTITIFRITTINEVDLDVGSSSSVAESSSSAFEPCTGTVIYDASDDPLKTAFGTKFVYQGRFVAGNVDADENGLNLMFDGLTYANLDFDKTRNISSWEGLCIEYTADATVTLYLSSTGDDGQNAGETNQMAAKFNIKPTSKKQVFEAMWKDAIESADFNYDKVSILSFGSDWTANLVVSKITTIAKDVDLNAGASSEDPSTGYILPTNKCPGTEIYNEDKGSIFEFPVKSWNEGNTTTTLTDMSLIGSTGDDGVYFFIADYPSGTPISIEQWGGLCLEYTSTNNMYVEIANVQNSQTSSLASSTLPAQETKIAYAIPLKAFYDVYEDGDIYFVNERFDPAKVNRISFTNIDGGTTQASISRITTLYPGVTFE